MICKSISLQRAVVAADWTEALEADLRARLNSLKSVRESRTDCLLSDCVMSDVPC